MTQEDKELLLKDLSARFPYGVKIKHITQRADACQAEVSFTERLNVYTLKVMMEFKKEDFPFFLNKPYLFPLSSMTEEQHNEFFAYFHDVEMKEIETSEDYLKASYLGENAKRDWLNKNHFDYHYLIPKGLAIDATGLNIY